MKPTDPIQRVLRQARRDGYLLLAAHPDKFSAAARSLRLEWEKDCARRQDAVVIVQDDGEQAEVSLTARHRLSPYALEDWHALLEIYRANGSFDSHELHLRVRSKFAPEVAREVRGLWRRDTTRARQQQLVAQSPEKLIEGLARLGPDAPKDYFPGDDSTLFYIREFPNRRGHCIAWSSLGHAPVFGHCDCFELLYDYE
jgi:hypothetical protein